jgi:hypothetical protein
VKAFSIENKSCSIIFIWNLHAYSLYIFIVYLHVHITLYWRVALTFYINNLYDYICAIICTKLTYVKGLQAIILI